MALPQSSRSSRATIKVLFLATLNCAFQIAWFWQLIRRNINYDAISYIGIARHIADGDFHASLRGYWSPLLSWIIAAAAIFSANFTMMGRLVTISSFVACLGLLYLLTFQLWRSPLLAALAVLWFTAVRGAVAFAVSFIGADFLLSAIVLLYSICLLNCLRRPSARNWLLLGIPHGVAFLAKAFAMPWLALSSLLGSVLSREQNFRRKLVFAAAAIAIPIVVWFSWGAVLESRYGMFTAGYQSKWNLISQQQREEAVRRGGQLSFLYDTSRSYDSYMVVDNMFPGSPIWQAHINPAVTLRLVLANERQNLPSAIRQLVVLLTPGGILALGLACWSFARDRQRPEARFLKLVLFNAATLVVGYSMLVFDERYVLPLVPLLIAVAVPLVLPRTNADSVPNPFARVRLMAGLLLLASTIFFQVYWASPFRTLNRDYETSCYDAAQKLLAAPGCKRLVVIGRGPYQEHGMGWEAGLYASYFAGCRMLAFSPDLPALAQIPSARTDFFAVNPDAVLLLGRKGNAAFDALASAIRTASPGLTSREIVDPRAGQVGEVLWGMTAVASKSDGSSIRE